MKGIYERKQHFKMYKAKKQWLLAGLTVLGGLFLAGMPVAQADTAGYTPTTVTPKQTATEQQVNAAPTVSASAQVVPASQATVPASQQAAPVAMYKAVAEQATPTVSTLKLTEESKDGHWYLKDANATDPAKQYVNGWHSLSNNRVAYYDPSTYQMVYGEHNIDGKWYYFNEQSGDVQEGWYRLPDGREVYYDVHKKQNGVDGEGMLHGMSAKPSSDKSAYFYFNVASGAQETGFKQVNNHTYYFAPTRVQNQEKQINGAWYYFKADGTMATGFTTLPSGKSVYYQNNGQMAYGQQTINGHGYYFVPQSGEEVRNQEVNLNGHWYFYRQDGTMATG
ncbi:KxYKxGKxW signal peptide domain-containing protein, partial [Limosilactobacillus ingluviei]|uniref:KxYKxGKxW signal peptide domain-containing protein n=1 Tax=Limosilactobacillus ingluviei TaxID=148604 RepID=UPI000595288C